MNTPDHEPGESNLRQQLNAAADNLHPAPPSVTAMVARGRRLRHHRQAASAIALGAAALAAIVVVPQVDIPSFVVEPSASSPPTSAASPSRTPRAPTTPHSPAATTSPPSTGAPTPTPGSRVGPWSATVVHTWRRVVTPRLVGVDGQLYVLGSDAANTQGPWPALARLNPATGDVRAQARVAGQLVGVADEKFWSVSQQADTSTLILHSYALGSLHPAGTRRIGLTSQAHGALGGHATSAHDLYLGVGDKVLVINPGTGTVTRRIALGARVRQIAATADGSTLYVLTNDSGNPQNAHVQAVQVRSGTIRPAGSGNVTLLAATSGGLWLESYGGMSATVQFWPGGDSRHPVAMPPAASGGGGAEPHVTVSGGVAWISGMNGLACADPDSGRTQATAAGRQNSQGGPSGTFGDIATVDADAYGMYFDADGHGSVALVRLRPPAACR